MRLSAVNLNLDQYAIPLEALKAFSLVELASRGENVSVECFYVVNPCYLVPQAMMDKIFYLNVAEWCVGRSCCLPPF